MHFVFLCLCLVFIPKLLSASEKCSDHLTRHFRWIGQSEDLDVVVLRRFKGNFRFPDYATADWILKNKHLLSTGVVVDVETTGLDLERDTVIEIGLRSFLYHRKTGEILSILDSYSGVQDPGVALPEDIVTLTGLSDDKLRGKNIDWKAVETILSNADVVLSHNAGFDRAFVDRMAPVSSQKHWGCSLTHIDWKAKGYTSTKLELLNIYHGFFVDSHRALEDVDALIHLLTFSGPDATRPYFLELLLNARRPMARVNAVDSPFERKHLLKARGYYWDSKLKTWYKLIYQDTMETELKWLESSLYEGSFPGKIIPIALIDNFKLSP